VVAWLPFGFEVGRCSVDGFVVVASVFESLGQRAVSGQKAVRDVMAI
jgi:hypothetical protein